MTPERPHVKGRLDPRRNSLNLIRLVFAFMVLVAHAYHVAGYPPGPMIAGDNLGGWGVIGFFTVSGYLITGSRFRTGLTTFLLHRVARIYPAFVVSLVVVAFGFAPVAYLYERGSLTGFLTASPSPLSFVWLNLGLLMQSYSIAGTLSSNPHAPSWNGSLWTLFFEFCCYLLIGLMVMLPIVRRHPKVLGIAFGFSVALLASMPVLSMVVPNPALPLLAKLLPYFLGGAFVWAIRDRVALRWYVAMPSAVTSALVIWFVNDVLQLAFGGQLVAPLLTVVVLWAASVLPQPGLISRNDISYGVYVYAWPVQMLVTLFGGASHGVLVHVLLTLPGTVLLAILSWQFVERPAMHLARRLTGTGVSTPVIPHQSTRPVRKGPDATMCGEPSRAPAERG